MYCNIAVVVNNGRTETSELPKASIHEIFPLPSWGSYTTVVVVKSSSNRAKA